MKTFLLASLSLFLAACAGKETKPFDRTGQQAEYREEEAKNQARSLTRSEWMSKVKGLDSQIKAIDAQIKNQKNLIARYKEQSEVASSQAMIENAEVRIRHLKEEREQLEEQRNEAQEQLKNL